MKEDNISQLGNYDAPFCEQEFTHGSCCISLFKFKSFDQFNTPQTASNFRHLLSCGTIVFTICSLYFIICLFTICHHMFTISPPYAHCIITI